MQAGRAGILQSRDLMTEQTVSSRRRSGDPELFAEIEAGLAASPMRLPPKLFYDERGSRLFEQITELPEYYLTRTERALLDSVGSGWVRDLEPRTLVELGAGSAEKTRILLDAMRSGGEPGTYVPVDVSAEFLHESARKLKAEYAELDVRPHVADITRPLRLDGTLPRPLLVAFLGSTIGNFEDHEAAAILSGVSASLLEHDRFLLGADLAKDRAALEAAYNDARGVTAEFNLNMLRVLNRRFGADFDVGAFEHHAFYNEPHGRVEMHLVSKRDQTIQIPGLAPLEMPEGADIRTEVSNKYTPERLEQILGDAGLEIVDFATDEAGRYALVSAQA